MLNSKQLKADPGSLVSAINEKLPAGAEIPQPKKQAPQSRRRTRRAAAPTKNNRKSDRKAATPPVHRKTRFFGAKSAFFVSALVIAAALIIPRFIKELEDNRLKTATAVEDSTLPTDLERPPTYIVGPAVDELVRGVKYTIEGIEQVVFKAPLPTNPGNLTASFRMQMTNDAYGKVTTLTPTSTEISAFETVVVDSMLLWQFSAQPDSDSTSRARCNGRVFPGMNSIRGAGERGSVLVQEASFSAISTAGKAAEDGASSSIASSSITSCRISLYVSCRSGVSLLKEVYS